MQLTNSQMAYGLLSKLLHAVMGVIFLYVFYVGYTMESMPDGDAKWAEYGVHKAYGALMLCLIIVRLLANFVQIKPLPLQTDKFSEFLAMVVHIGLYIVLVMFPLSGYVMSTGLGHDVVMFGYTLPNLVGENEVVGLAAKAVHQSLVLFGFVLVPLHFLAVLKNQFIGKKNALGRMFSF